MIEQKIVQAALAKALPGEPLPEIVCDGPVLRLRYPEALYALRTSADVEALRRVGDLVLASSDVTASPGAQTVTLRFAPAPKK